MEQEYLSPTQAAKILGISRQAVIERIKTGNLHAEKVGSRYIIPKNIVIPKESPGLGSNIDMPISDKKGRKEAIRSIFAKII